MNTDIDFTLLKHYSEKKNNRTFNNKSKYDTITIFMDFSFTYGFCEA